MSDQMKTPRLRDSIAALGVVQVANYILPLITLPYLARVLGAEAFGKVAFAQAIMAYFVLLVEYGFSWSATRTVAAHRTDSSTLCRVFAATWAAQWLLLALAALVAAAVILLTDRLRPDALLYAAAFTSVVGVVMFPMWFLQGLEQLRVVAFFQILTRIMVLPLIFLFIKSPNDTMWLLFIQGGAVILSGVLSLYWMHRKSIIVWRFPSWSDIFLVLREGGVLFGSRVSISFYTALIPLVLGWIAGPVALAHFNLADKIRGAAQSLLAPVSQALFPRMSHLVLNRGEEAYDLMKKSVWFMVVVSGSIGAILWGCADWLIVLLGGEAFSPAAEVLRWLAFLPLIIGLSNMFGVQIMLPHRLNRCFNVVLITASVVSLVLVIPLTHSFGATGAAHTMLIVELCVTGFMAAVLWRKGYFGLKPWIAHSKADR